MGGEIFVPKGQFDLSQGTKNSDGTITIGKNDWAIIRGNNINSDKTMDLINKSAKSVMHLFVNEIKDSGVAWLKWDDTNNRIEFASHVGSNTIQLPSAEEETRFRLVLHAFFDSVTIDPEKSYVEAVAK